MTIDTVTGRFSWMQWIPGPPERVYPGRNTMEFYIAHDMVGYYNGGSVPGVMLDPSRRASWPWTYGETAAFQHYPVWACTWTSGSEYWNRNGVAPETSRTMRPLQDDAEPLTLAQLEMHCRAIADIEEYRQRIGLRPITFRRSLGTIREHREVSPVVTTCPNGRMQPLYDALEDEMSVEDKARLDRLERIVAANGIDVEGQRLVGEAALSFLSDNGSSAFLSIRNLNTVLRLHDEDIVSIGDSVHEHTTKHPGGQTVDEIERIAVDAVADKLTGVTP